MELNYTLMGLQIRRHRKEQRLTQEALGAKCNHSASYISNLENAHSKPSLAAMVQIANALHVGLDALLRDSLETVPPMVNGEFQELLAGCKPWQLRIVEDTMRTLIHSLLDRSPKSEED